MKASGLLISGRTGDDGLVPGEEVGEGGVGVVEHEVVLGAGQPHEVDGVGARGHGVVGRGRAVRRSVVQAVAAAARLRLAAARARDLDHQVGAATAPPCALQAPYTFNYLIHRTLEKSYVTYLNGLHLLLRFEKCSRI